MVKIPFFIITVLMATACAVQPVINPERWVEDYDYKEPFSDYLDRKYNESVNKENVPYIYVYGNWCPACRILRSKAKRDPEYSEIFRETQIYLLDYDRLINVKGAPDFRGVPVIAPITEEGKLGDLVMYGVPWRNTLPENIKYELCVYFDHLKLISSTLNRNCYQYKL